MPGKRVHPLKTDGKSWDKKAVMAWICQQTQIRSEGLLKILATGTPYGGLPTPITINKWLREDEEIAAEYARAKSHQAHVLADEVLDISDDETTDVQHRRLQIDARKWLAGKLNSQYSDNRVALTGADGGPVQVQVVQRVVVDPKRIEQGITVEGEAKEDK